MSTPLETVRDRLREFAAQEVDESPLYAHLAARAAEDPDVAGLLATVAVDDAVPTLLLAAVHRLVIAEPISDLARYYPSVGGECGVDAVTWSIFRAFALDRAARVRELLASHVTQTNEVRRAALLYPGIATAARQAGGPIGLLEVGASAGLLLDLDRYGYRYEIGGERILAGPPKPPLVLDSALTFGPGAGKPPLPKKLAVQAKIGLDRHPVDLRDEEALAWLEACVWADQPERVRLLNIAARAQASKPPEILAGDVVDDLAVAAARIPTTLPLVVFSSHLLTYLGISRRADFMAALGALAAERPLWWVSQESDDVALPLLAGHGVDPKRGGSRLPGRLCLVRWPGGKPAGAVLAHTVSHGQRMEWLAS